MLSVVIPALNEAERIELAVDQVRDHECVDEVIVVDGHSTDDTAARARAAGAIVVDSERGRGRQLNVGARRARGDLLLFLHADVGVPPSALNAIRSTLAEDGVVAGAFLTWHRPERWRGSWKAWLLHLADLRCRYSPLPYGDQGLFVTRTTFEQLGGFPEIPLMEDLAFSRSLKRLGRIARVPEKLAVSGRRFESSPLYQTFLVNVFPLLYDLGVPLETLARLYGNPR